MEALARIGNELAKVEEGKLKAFTDNDRVLIMIQDAPTELRRLAAALEKLNVTEIQALVAYKTPAPIELDRIKGAEDESAAGAKRKGGGPDRKG